MAFLTLHHPNDDTVKRNYTKPIILLRTTYPDYLGFVMILVAGLFCGGGKMDGQLKLEFCQGF